MATVLMEVGRSDKAELAVDVERDSGYSTERRVSIVIDGHSGDTLSLYVDLSRVERLAQCFEELARMLRSPQGGIWEVRS